MRVAPKPGWTPVVAKKPPQSKLEVVKEAWREGPMWARSAMLGYAAGVASSAGPGTYVHEMGHKLAIQTLFSNSEPVIQVKPFHGGGTRWHASPLTPLGEHLGDGKSHAAVAAAGPAMDLFTSMAAFGVGFKIRKEHPNVGATLMGYAGYRVAVEVIYALTPCVDACRGHDFVKFGAASGLAPWAAAAVFAAALPIQYMVMKKLEERSS